MKKRHLILFALLVMQGTLVACASVKNQEEIEPSKEAQKNQVVILEPTLRQPKEDLTQEKAEEELILRLSELEGAKLLEQDNLVYCANRYIGNVPSFNQWKGVFQLSQLADHFAYGRQFIEAEQKKECSLVTDYRLDINQSLQEYEMVKGNWQQEKGQCAISKNIAEELKKEVGDKILLKTETGSKPFKIVGVFEYTKEFLTQYPDADRAIDEIYIKKEDYIECLLEDSIGNYFPWFFECKDKEEAIAFATAAQEKISEDFVIFYTKDELEVLLKGKAQTTPTEAAEQEGSGSFDAGSGNVCTE